MANESIRENMQPLYVENILGWIQTFNVENSRGVVQTLKIPKTWIPIDLTEQAKFTDIMESPDFRMLKSRKTADNKPFIRQLSEKDAKAILNTEHAKKEMQRLNNLRFNNVLHSADIAPIVDANEDQPTASDEMSEEMHMARLSAIDNEDELLNEVMLLIRSDRMTDDLSSTLARYAEEKGFTGIISALRTNNALE